jgi:hypothetical protein
MGLHDPTRSGTFRLLYVSCKTMKLDLAEGPGKEHIVRFQFIR